ncbi:Scr1 family TA system antitoxin-like transcriptional regulator [Streptomyces sp. NPDC060184]|uniref:helix-turn-helix domain-containing protein n=1 Tax=Streptomyces sp. NPDC060184 TaxID=3347064 RepID=UPI0036503A59
MHSRKPQRKNASATKLVGKLVALFRLTAGLTQAQLAAKVGVQVETIASIEQGRRALLPHLADRLDELLDTKGALATAVEYLPEVDLLPAGAGRYIDLEREALSLSWFENQVLPGLLQTENYARAVLRCKIPVFSAKELESQVAIRMARQEILRRDTPPTLSFVISEAILRDRIGGQDTYYENLHLLSECSTLPHVSLQVMPLGRTTHAGLGGPFILLETPDYQRLGYTERQRRSRVVESPEEVSILTQKFGMLRTQALNTEETRSLLDRLLAER